MSSQRVLGNEDLIYLTILTAMYNNNDAQIQNLQRANDDIRTSMLAIINQYVNADRPTHNTPTLFPLTPPVTRTFLRRNVTPPRAPVHNRRNGLPINQLMDNFLSPIVIRPSQTQIEAATRNVRYNDIIRPINSSCPISLESFNDNSQVTMIRHCGHIFNRDMLNLWFQRNYLCPVCRYDIRDYVPNNNVNQDEQQNIRPTLVTPLNTEERNSNSTNNRPTTPDVPLSELNTLISENAQERILDYLLNNIDANIENNFNNYNNNNV